MIPFSLLSLFRISGGVDSLNDFLSKPIEVVVVVVVLSSWSLIILTSSSLSLSIKIDKRSLFNVGDILVHFKWLSISTICSCSSSSTDSSSINSSSDSSSGVSSSTNNDETKWNDKLLWLSTRCILVNNDDKPDDSNE